MIGPFRRSIIATARGPRTVCGSSPPIARLFPQAIFCPSQQHHGRFVLGRNATQDFSPLHGAICSAGRTHVSGSREIREETETAGADHTAPPTPGATITPPNAAPFPLRVALVAAATGAATPFFVLAGAALMWTRYLPNSIIGLGIKYGIGVLGGCGIVGLVYNHLAPWVLTHGDLVLPFAVANGVTAGLWYAALETKMGLQWMAGLVSLEAVPAALRGVLKLVSVPGVGAVGAEAAAQGVAASSAGLPVGGLLVGVLTAATSFLLFPPMMDLFLDSELKAFIFPHGTTTLADWYVNMLVPVGLPCGMCCGYALHALLAKPVLTQTPVHPAALLAGLLTTMGLYWYKSKISVDDLKWVHRIDPATGRLYSLNVGVGESGGERR